MIVIGMRRHKPLSSVKRADALKIAQRLYDAKGFLRVNEFYETCRKRIPGSRGRYYATLAYLLKRRYLKHHKPQG